MRRGECTAKLKLKLTAGSSGEPTVGLLFKDESVMSFTYVYVVYEN